MEGGREGREKRSGGGIGESEKGGEIEIEGRERCGGRRETGTEKRGSPVSARRYK